MDLDLSTLGVIFGESYSIMGYIDSDGADTSFRPEVA